MTQEQFTMFWNYLKAPLQAKWDKFTDEDLHQIDGNILKFNGVLDLRYGAQKEAVSTWTNRRYSHVSGNYDGYDFSAKSPDF